jgi:NCS1 family nucleobase:cation symporter-1
MSTEENKQFYDEKSGSPAASAAAADDVKTGHVSGLRRRFPGFSLTVRQEESSFAATPRASNADFDPIPPSKRTWNWGAYVAYWMADAWAVSNWEVGESPRDVLRPWSQRVRRC